MAATTTGILTVPFWLAYNATLRGCSSVVERLLPKQDIVGSSPITRSDSQSRCVPVEERPPRHFCLVICKVPVMSSPNSPM